LIGEEKVRIGSLVSAIDGVGFIGQCGKLFMYLYNLT